MIRTLRHHLAAALILGITAWLTTVGVKEYMPGTLNTRAFGYGTLVLLSITLMIGPLSRLAPRLLARLIPYRRATGIWSAASGVLHLLYALQLTRGYHFTLVSTFISRIEVTQDGVKSVAYFLDMSDYFAQSVQPLAWAGLAALTILVIIALVSNDWVQRWLGHATWKLIQQQAYTAFCFVSLHVLLMKFGHKLKGSPALLKWAPWLLLAVAVLQFAGFTYTVWKQGLARARRQPPPPGDISA